MPKTPNDHRPMASVPPVNTLLLKRVTSIIGCFDLDSMITKAAAEPAVTATRGRFQPSMSPKVRANRAIAEVTRPGRSRLCRTRWVSGRMAHRASANVATPMGTLIR
ncbi:hypothetical protein GCM10020219_009610 [Nonomuraea dietziae]